jgi:hypothetical protein
MFDGMRGGQLTMDVDKLVSEISEIVVYAHNEHRESAGTPTPSQDEIDSWHRDVGTTPYSERQHKDRPEWAYNEDGYCVDCGNGNFKFHAPWCEIAELFDMQSRSKTPQSTTEETRAMTPEGLQAIKDDLLTVTEARTYTREHFPLGSPNRYVGHTPSNDYDAAIDRLTECIPALLKESDDRRLRLHEVDHIVGNEDNLGPDECAGLRAVVFDITDSRRPDISTCFVDASAADLTVDAQETSK